LENKPVDHFDKHLQRAVPKLTSMLREHATSQGWGDHITPNLNVKIDGHHISVHYPDSLKDEIHTLEYGHLEQAPRPAFRSFNVAAEQVLASALGMGFAETFAEMFT
jgi:hypothetical protein